MAAKPTVFLGSASEDLQIVSLLKENLSDIASVVPWTARAFRTPGGFFLDDLLKAARSFDFAILLFGAHDRILKRKQRPIAVRDNVVFELGLFMSRLDRSRAIVLTPSPWRLNIAIASDLANLNLTEFDPPKEPITRRKLQKSLAEPLDQIRHQITQRGPRVRDRGPDSQQELLSQIRKRLKEKTAPQHHVQNIALDMEVTWPHLRDNLFRNEQEVPVRWQSLMIDPDCELLANLGSDTVSAEEARKKIATIRKYCNKNRRMLKEHGIEFECRTYSLLPPVHGFLIDHRELHVSTCGIQDESLVAGNSWYFSMARPAEHRADPAAAHLVELFSGWFNHLFARGNAVWPD